MRRPTPTIEMKLSVEAVRARFGELTALAEIVGQVRGSHGNRVAVELLLNGVGMMPTSIRNEPYYGEMLDYQLGLLLAHLGQAEAAANLIRRSGALPHSGGNWLFPDIVAEGLELQARAIEASARGLPPILIAAMPAGGSASLAQSIAATLDMPVMRLSAGNFPDYIMMPSWLERFSAGGALTHDHFGATPFNLRVLEEVGWKQVFVLIRDPRAAAAALARKEMAAYGQALEGEEAARRIVHLAAAAVIPWLNLWTAAEERTALRIHWIRYDEVCADVGAVIQRIIDILQPDYPAVAAMRDNPTRAVTANFAVGDDQAWRTLISAEAARSLWPAIASRAVDLLGMEP